MKPYQTTIAVLVTAMALTVSAVEVQVGETGSALICPRSYTAWQGTAADSNWTTWVGANLNGSRSTDNRYMPKSRSTFAASGIILWYFDLTAQSGKLATANAEVSCNVLWGWTGSETYRIHPILSNWNESTVTWSNWIGEGFTGSGDKTYTNWFGPELDADTVAGTVKSTWTITQSVVQTWLNNPGLFKGLAIIPDTDGARYFFSRQATWKPAEDLPLMVLQVQSPNNPPVTPTNQTPANAAIAQPLTPTLIASPFSDPNGHGHAESQWQVAPDVAFLSPAVNVQSAIDLTSHTITAGALKPNTRYYWRVRYKDNAAEAEWSAWSAPTYFDTLLDISQPVVIPALQSAWIRSAVSISNFNPLNTSLFELNSANGSAPSSLIMHQFDLRVFSMYPDLAISGDGQCAYTLNYTWPNNPPNVELYELTAPWAATTVTWSNYIGEAAWTERVNRLMDAKVIENFNAGQTETWSSVSAEVLRDWLATPASNHGLAMLTQDGAALNVQFRSMPMPWLIVEFANTNLPTPNQPSNVSPANGAAGQALMPLLQASAYSGTGTHAASRWQIAEDAQMIATVWDSGSTGALTSVTVPAGRLQYTGRYYWRVRYINELGGQSAWSAPTYFDTDVQGGIISRKAARTSLISFAEPDKNYNGINDNTFKFVGRSNSVAATMLCWFDLGILQGQQLNGPAQLRLSWDYVDIIFGSQTFSCYPLLQDWDETNVTWESYNGPGNENYYQHFGLLQDTQEALQYESNFFTISQAVVQEWLDTGVSNFGVAFYPDNTTPNAFVFSRKSPLKAPTLILDVVPEPASLVALVALLAAWRARKRQ
ncbi:MAG TPA: DNRLRE domain-containing protein [Lentisphaeria bacterium]|mgnify:CR=1 FL=1|nr:DNRLRE domain-containing protein [Lentisphaeria bacterium]